MKAAGTGNNETTNDGIVEQGSSSFNGNPVGGETHHNPIINHYRVKRNDTLTKFMEVANKSNNSSSEYKLKIVPTSREELKVGIDGALFGITVGEVTVVGYMALLGTSEPLDAMYIKSGNTDFVMDSFEQDILSVESAKNALINHIKKEFRGNKTTLVAPPSYMRITSNPSDENAFEEEVTNIMIKVFDGIMTTLERYYLTTPNVSNSIAAAVGHNGLSKQYLENRTNGSNIQINISKYNGADSCERDSNGIPLSPDIIFKSKSISPGASKTILSSGSTEIATVCVTPDVLRVGPPAMTPEGSVVQGQNADKVSQIYDPIFRISGINTEESTFAALLGGIITATVPLLNNNAYLWPFMRGKSELRTQMLRDSHIGGIWAETNFLHEDANATGGHANEEFLVIAEEKRLALLNDVLRKRPRFFMNISALDQDSYLTSVLLGASHGLGTGAGSYNGVSNETDYKAIYAECVRMGGAKFKELFKYGTPFAVKTGSLRPIGKFVNKEGEQNINRKTHLYFLNRFSGNADMLRVLTEEVSSILYSRAENTSRTRFQQFKNFLCEDDASTEIIGYGEEIEINPQFITALTNSYVETGLSIVTPDIGYADQRNDQRATFGAAFSSGGSVNVNNPNSGFGTGSLTGGTVSNGGFTLF